MMIDLKNSNNFKLSPGEILGKVRRKPRSWFKIFLNLIGGAFLLFLLVFGVYRMWVYYSIGQMTPQENVEFYLIADDQALEHSQYWSTLLRSYLENNSNLNPALWDILLEENQYYLSIYKRSPESPIEFLFYLPKLGELEQKILIESELAFVYNGKYLLLNNTVYHKNLAETSFFDFNILNRMAVGTYQGNYFIAYEADEQIKVDLPNIKEESAAHQSYFNYLTKSDRLLFASNRLKWQELSDLLPFLSAMPLSLENKLELAIYNTENHFFGQDFSLVLKSVAEPAAFLNDLAYLLAFNNRQFKETILTDASVVTETVLDFSKYTWQTENFYQKILVNENENIYLYSTLRDGDLIISSQLSDLENLNSVQLANLSNYDFINSKTFSSFYPEFSLNEFNRNLLFKYSGFLQIESCE